MNERTALIIGGTDGLGFEIAKLLSAQGLRVVVTGRNGEKIKETASLEFIPLSIGTDACMLGKDIDTLLSTVGHIDTLVYTPGFNQYGKIETLTDDDIVLQLNVTITAFAFLMERLFKQQEVLKNMIVITSTSQISPRPLEPVYAGAKAGLAHLAHSIANDESKRITKTLTVLPAGMNTKLLRQRGIIDTSTLLDPAWVASEIVKYFDLQDVHYEECLILREPPRVEKRVLPFP